MLFIHHLKALSGRFSEPSNVFSNNHYKKNQGITFGLWLQGFAHLCSWFLCKWDKNTALEGKIHLFKECMLKLLREIVEAPSVIPSLYHSCLCFTFHVVTCKKAECNLPSFLFFGISYNVAVVLWQSMKFYTKLFIMSVSRKAWIPLGLNLLCF